MPLKVNPSGTIADVLDFDDSLVPDSTSKLLRSRAGSSDDQIVDFSKNKAGSLVKMGYDPTHAYLKLLLD